jgi:double-strand break repair protein MRE11
MDGILTHCVRDIRVSPVPDDTIKIMLATDNHIGYLERDPVRGHDAINTFEEILQLASKHDVGLL